MRQTEQQRVDPLASPLRGNSPPSKEVLVNSRKNKVFDHRHLQQTNGFGLTTQLSGLICELHPQLMKSDNRHTKHLQLRLTDQI